MVNCPICDAPLKTWHDTENGVTSEEGQECKVCGYIREFAFGSYQVKVQGNIYEWSHCTPWLEIQQLEQDIRHDIELARAALYSV